METNIFENAKFGDKFMMRNGKIAIFDESFYPTIQRGFTLLLEGHNGLVEFFYPNGRFDIKEETCLDIIEKIG